jgi:hypothetical protein
MDTNSFVKQLIHRINQEDYPVLLLETRRNQDSRKVQLKSHQNSTFYGVFVDEDKNEPFRVSESTIQNNSFKVTVVS